ncbi:MAG: hypothetical protein V4682_00500 [Patescibacteria group bacterium]
MYEIEHRTLLTEDSYTALLEKLTQEGTLIGQDDKEVEYIIFPDKLLKVVNNLSKNTGVLSLKLNALGEGSSFQEFEVPFPADQYETMRSICHAISEPQQIIAGTQKRTNFKYGEVEIALKWSEDWKYHAELEIVVADLSEKDEADKKIMQAAENLSITLMSQEEIAEFAAKVRASKQ